MEGSGRKITLGVCVMEKKVFSAPMGKILERLQAFGEFEIIYFGDKVILKDPIESWPVCVCLIVFCSSGYPLEKAEAYVALRKHYSAETIRRALNLGVNVKMITGDQLAIAKETGRHLGIGINMYPSSALMGQNKDPAIDSLPVDELIEKADGFAGVFLSTNMKL